MTRCKEFYDKWEKVPNWCEKCKSSVSRINSYIELVKEFEKMGVPRKLTIGNLPESAARPIYTERDPETREKLMGTIKTWLLTGKSHAYFLREQTEKRKADWAAVVAQCEKREAERQAIPLMARHEMLNRSNG